LPRELGEIWHFEPRRGMISDRSQRDTVSCTCRVAAWVLSHIASVASLKRGRLTPASYEISTLYPLAQLLVSQLEFLEVVLLRFLSLDLEFSLPQ
jgi:hypothetical protein